MRVFPDTNVLASAFGTRGLCADVLRLILAEHELIVGEAVIEELCRALTRKFKVPASSVEEIEGFLRSYDVTPRPGKLPDLKLHDKDDLVIVASALAASAEILITGDRELIELREKPKGLKICSPRDFWNLLSGTGKP